MYTVVKRDGKIVEFNLEKIKDAIVLAFEACETQYHRLFGAQGNRRF